MIIKRYERKWLIKKINKDQLNLILARSSFFFKDQFPNRKVNSIYFDDNKLSSVRENIDGINHKQKIRVRWYGNSSLINKANIEIKKKVGFQNSKLQLNINEINNFSHKKNKDLNLIKNLVKKKIKSSKVLRPTAITSYDRQYYISNNNLIRATLDFNIKSSLIKSNFDLDVTKNYSHLILELKYDVDLDDFVRFNLKNNSFRLSKNSKYVNSFILNRSFTT